MNLQNWIDQARSHWKEFQPTRFAELKQAGTLEASLKDAAEQTYQQTSQLEKAGFQPDEAFQMVREDYLFPPAERSSPSSSAPSLSAQMRKAAQTGQRTMPVR